MVAKVIGELMVLMRSSPRAIMPATRFSALPDQGWTARGPPPAKGDNADEQIINL
jgi:hypothetical protein